MIYAIIDGHYSDWEIIGYFTDRLDAEKYCIKNNDRYYIEEIKCIDGIEDLSNIKVRYERSVLFQKNNGSWSCLSNVDDNRYLDFYQSPFPRSNKVSTYNNPYISVFVNTDVNNFELQKKIAEDILYQYLESCDGKPNGKAATAFNKILSADEDARKQAEKEEKIRQKELKELERLKNKYEKLAAPPNLKEI